MTYLETRIKKLERDLSLDDKDHEWHAIIWHRFKPETLDEAKSRYEQEYKTKIEPDDNLIIMTIVETREQVERLKKDKQNGNRTSA